MWVETDTPCEVRVLGPPRTHSARTFAVHGHHYALVEVDGLAPGSVTRYTVQLDGEDVWPEPGSAFPHPRIRTHDRGDRVRLVFGSCRRAAPHDPRHNAALGVDALRAYACRLAARSGDAAGDAGDADWPDVLLLLGDQLYADSPSSRVREFLDARRRLNEPPGQVPGTELANFEEYTYLYRTTWTDPAVRWLLSTVPTAMLFDDHDIRDDWNTSQAWRDAMHRVPWWQDRLIGGLASYWIYQHLGNLSPRERAADPILAAVRETRGDAGAVLDELALAVDRDPQEYRFSYGRDFGSTRLIAVDTRCGRVLEPGRRDMLDPPEWQWLDEYARGDVDHLLIASSLPYLLAPAVHYGERWNEGVCDGRWGRRAADAAERLRQEIDLEHWSAFQRSFDAMARVATEVAAGRRGAAPASVGFLSGDVHYSYLARVTGGAEHAPIYQAVCSPVRNPLGGSLRWASSLSCTDTATRIGKLLAGLTGTPATPLSWRVERGPWFRNNLATVDIDGRRCTVRWEAADSDGTGQPRMHHLDTVRVA